MTNDGEEKKIRLHEGELNVMELLWSNKELAAKDIAKIIKEYIGWKKIRHIPLLNVLLIKALLKELSLVLYAGQLYQNVKSRK